MTPSDDNVIALLNPADIGDSSALFIERRAPKKLGIDYCFDR